MKKPNARQRILQTAGELFHRRGFSEVGINEIIDKAETAKATFYQHFPSKVKLCEAWLEDVHERSGAARRAILESDATVEEKVDRCFDELERYMKMSEYRGCPYSNTSAVVEEGCSGIVEQVTIHKQSIRDFFCELGSQATGDRQCSCSLGETLFVLYSGAATEAQNLKELWPVQAARRAAAELCRAAVAKASGGKADN